ncbi:cytochrome o ubiquinol oxidase subunit I [Candidatus Saccharibacteria bacterium]|nr:cytochrome o ubiquinol oxidase subunit I [Candidatus Saccharibacteria bacterium]
MFGRLGFDDLPTELITIGGALSMVGGLIAVTAGLIYFKKLGWLWRNWLTSLDHKKIGVMYIAIAVIMLLRGAGDAVMMRAQQALASGDSTGILSSDTFQQVFSAHGTIMIFFVAMGLMFGLINLVLPLQLGARDVAFPFLNSLSFWLFASGFVLINASLVIGEFSAAGWLAYPPLSGLEYSPGVGVDYWIWALQISGLGSLLSGINFLVTILKMRAPGMKLMDMPIFAWTVLGSMMLVIAVFPILTVTLSLLALDRLMGMNFFTSTLGGNPMMYINLIWAWGHPEVYILVLPAFGIFSEIVPVFSKKKLFGYTSMVWAIMSITVLSFIVWLHHFFTMGGGAKVNAFFGIMTMVISIPTGVKVFNWLFTMFRGKITYSSPMIWFLGFIATFTIGGMTGVLMAVPAIDFQVHNSLFLVAHFHNMIIGGVVFGYMAGLTYWFPKFTGFKLHEGLGKLAAWLWINGFIVAFGPLYILGLMGATRRIDHYDASLGWQWLFIIAGIGVLIIGAGIATQILQLGYSIWKRKELRDSTNGDPWDGRTLEWSTTAPPPHYNFAVIPEVKGQDSLWTSKQAKTTTKQSTTYNDIEMPKNTDAGIKLSAFAFLIGFGLVWHIWWLALIGLFGVIIQTILHLTKDDHEYTISAKDIKLHEQHRLKGTSL